MSPRGSEPLSDGHGYRLTAVPHIVVMVVGERWGRRWALLGGHAGDLHQTRVAESNSSQKWVDIEKKINHWADICFLSSRTAGPTLPSVQLDPIVPLKQIVRLKQILEFVQCLILPLEPKNCSTEINYFVGTKYAC